MFGLQNIGGTCYLNAVLQMLHKSLLFRINLIPNSPNPIVSVLHNTFAEMDKTITSARKIVSCMNINLGADSSGFILSKILDNIPENYKNNFTITFKNNDSAETLIITEIFGTDLVDTLNLYNIKSLSSGLIIDFTGNPNAAFVPTASFLYKGMRYKLTSVIIYSPGHYYAICLVDNTWVIFNDSAVVKLDRDINEILKGKQALVFMYINEVE
jgi:hypothetical protein